MSLELGYTTKAKVTRVIDGDTVDVEVRKVVRVRLLDVWAPEVTGAEKKAGLKSKAYMESLVEGREVVLHVPGDLEGKLANDFTFGRALGRIYVDGKDVSKLMVKAGMATKEKRKP